MNVTWTGPSGFVNHDVAAATDGTHVLEEGKTYEVGDELGISLCRSHADWQPADADAVQLLKADEDAPSLKWGRARLDTYAAAHGVGDPEQMENKQSVLDAIADAAAAP
jgi:hypothetical protein